MAGGAEDEDRAEEEVPELVDGIVGVGLTVTVYQDNTGVLGQGISTRELRPAMV